MLMCVCFFIIAPVVFSTVTTQQISATDWIYRHTVWIDRYIHGDLTPIWEYPPLFHLSMLPFVRDGFNMVLFQIIFSILNLVVIFWFVSKMHGREAMLLAGMMMATNYAYMQISSALMPQALDLLFFLPAIYFLINRKYNYSTVILFSGLLMHTTFLIYTVILALFSLLTKRYKFLPYAIIIILLVLPLYYHYFIIPTTQGVTVQWDSTAQCDWDMQFYTPLWKFFAMSGLISWFLLPFVINELCKQKFKLTEMQILYIIWMIAVLPLILGVSFYPTFKIEMCGGVWRGMSFFIIPMMLFEASILVNWFKPIKSNKVVSSEDKVRYKERFNEEFEK